MAFSTFLIVLFIAPVTPELQCEPKLIHDIRATAHNFAASGGGFFPSESSLDASDGVWMSLRTDSDTKSTDFEIEDLTAMIPTLYCNDGELPRA